MLVSLFGVGVGGWSWGVGGVWLEFGVLLSRVCIVSLRLLMIVVLIGF